MEKKLSYNELLYTTRLKLGLSRKQFAKKLHVPSLYYRFYENGYVKPSKKYIKRISEALNIDYSTYFNGIQSYPIELPDEDSKFQKWYKNIFSKKWPKIVAAVLTILSSATIGVSFYKYNYTMDNAQEFYSERYLNFVDEVREKGTMTFSLLHEMVRPEIHYSDEDKYISISTSSNNYSLRTLNAYANYKGENYNTYYIIPNLSYNTLSTLNVEYVDHQNLIKYKSIFNIENNTFSLSDSIYFEDGAPLEKDDEKYNEVVLRMKEHIDEVNYDFTSMIKLTLNLDYDFYTELLVDYKNGASLNLTTELVSLGMGIVGIGLSGLFLFTLLFMIFFGRKKEETDENLDVQFLLDSTPNNTNENKETLSKKPKFFSLTLEKKEPKKDIRFYPFIPETVFELAGIFLILFGSIRIILYMTNYFYNGGLTQEVFTQTTSNLFHAFTIGMFLLYFIDFDIFLDDRRSLRNFFLYGLIFIGLYFIECIMIDYLSKTTGVFLLITDFYTIPNNFSTISCYFGLMFFLFYSPKYLNTKKKLIIFRLMSIIPIAWILVSTLIFQNYKAWGLNLSTWELYIFASERPQFSLLCVIYLLSYYFLRLFIKWRYGIDHANKIFNGNKFYFIKNILVCLIIGIIAIIEYCLKNANTNIKGIGGYYQIVYLIPFLLFYHPHKGKRCKPVDYLTLILYGLFFSIGYIFAALVIVGLMLK